MLDDTAQLLLRYRSGEASVAELLLQRHRGRLRRMVGWRMDPRLAPRFDPSDVVQDALGLAAEQLVEYARNPIIPFYPWLRRLAWRRLVDLHRRHLGAHCRSVAREERPGASLSNESQFQLATKLIWRGPPPDATALQRELQLRLARALDRLDESQREVILLRYLEELTLSEVGSVLGISSEAVRMRHFRALKRLRMLLETDDGDA